MAKVPPPKKSAKGTPPPPTKTVGNLSKPERDTEAAPAPLNFKVPPDFRRDFKIYAAQHSMKLNELLYEAFRAYTEKNGR